MRVYVRNRFFSLRQGSDVVNDENNPVFKVKGKWPSIRKTKFVQDLDGNLLYKVRNKFWHFLYPSSYIFNSEGERICKVKRQLFKIKTNWIVEGLEDEISVQGNWVGWNLSVIKNGQEIGKISREFNLFKDAFKVDAEEKDIPFLVALVIAIDNIQDNASRDRS